MALAIGDRIDIPPGGSSTTNGTTGRALTFSAALPDTDYHVSITPSAAQAGQLGEVWVTKTTSGCTIYNDGATGISFTWAVTRY